MSAIIVFNHNELTEPHRNMLFWFYLVEVNAICNDFNTNNVIDVLHMECTAIAQVLSNYKKTHAKPFLKVLSWSWT